MRKLPKERDLLAAEVAQLLYLNDHKPTQSEVAKLLGIEKSSVSRLLQYAWDSGMVHVSLRLPRLHALEIELKRRYGIVDAVVEPVIAPRAEKDRWRFAQQLGEAAAAYIESEGGPLRPGQLIGISCGETLRETVLALTPRRLTEMSLTQLTVETQFDDKVDASPIALISLLRSKWPQTDASTTTYAVQPLPDTLRHEGQYTKAYEGHRTKITEKAKQVDVALVGIGVCEEGVGRGTFLELLKRNRVSSRKLQKAGAVGEICNHPYNAQGLSVIDQVDGLQNIVDSIDLETLRELVVKNRKVIAVAGGLSKVTAIKVALQTKLINYLVTDCDTAERLCAT